MQSTIKNYPELGEGSQKVIFKITKTKNIRIAIKCNLQITVSFSKHCSLKKAQAFFESKMIWTQNSLQKLTKRLEIRQQRQPSFMALDEQELLDRNHYLILRCRQLAQIHNFSMRKIILRRQKTIWGSCSVKNNISLNSNLSFLRNDLIDYVILHELVHTKIKNHSKNFWEESGRVLPNAKILNRELKKITLHGASKN